MGPLVGIRVVEFAGLGPGPFAAMMLADMGAEVLRIDRKPAPGTVPDERVGDVALRGRASLALDLKNAADVATALQAVERADLLIEGFRPGVMERLGLGPDVCLAGNPALVYGRMTGWGQSGPLSHAAGHDINYISISGALWSTGEADGPPVPPLNLVGDFGGGAMYLAFGLLAALYRARETGKGDVVDAAICDGVASMMGYMQGMLNRGGWRNRRASNRLDGSASYYGVYACADGKWISLGANEPQFFAELLERLGLDQEQFPDRQDPARWPEQRRILEKAFAGRTRDEWCALLEGTDVCFAPVLDLEEAHRHPHAVARGIYDHSQGYPQPAPAPRFREAPAELPPPPPAVGEKGPELLSRWLEAPVSR